MKLKDVIHFYLGCEAMIFTKSGAPRQSKLCLEDLVNYFILPTQELHKIVDIKPILRPISDMTEEEVEEIFGKTCLESDNDLYTSQEFLLLMKKGFDLFGLIETEQAINKTTLKL